jgi:hypothetical protein
MTLNFELRPRLIALVLGIIAIYLSAQSLFGEYILQNVLHGGSDSVPALLLDEFSVNAEQTIPTWFQVVMLLSIAVLLAAIALAKRTEKDRYAPYWTALAAIFLYLSMDEGAAIHEIVSEPLHTAFHTGGLLAFGWQILAAPLVIIVGLLFLRFVLHLPSGTRNLFMLAGVLYVGGALVVDAISASQVPASGELTLSYLAIGTLEELLEMLGMIVFIYALLSYIAAMHYEYAFRSRPAPVSEHPASAIAEGGPASVAGRTIPPRPVIRLALLGLTLIVGINLALVYWAVSQDAASVAAPNAPTSIYQAIIDQFKGDGLVISQVGGVFGGDNLTARQAASSLLTTFANVMVVSFPASDSTMVVAGNALPFDRNKLTEFLRMNGETQFIVFDTPAVRQIVGNVQSPK